MSANVTIRATTMGDAACDTAIACDRRNAFMLATWLHSIRNKLPKGANSIHTSVWLSEDSLKEGIPPTGNQFEETVTYATIQQLLDASLVTWDTTVTELIELLESRYSSLTNPSLVDYYDEFKELCTNQRVAKPPEAEEKLVVYYDVVIEYDQTGAQHIVYAMSTAGGAPSRMSHDDATALCPLDKWQWIKGISS